MSASEWFAALGDNVERNLGLLEQHFAKDPGELMPWCLYAMFAIAAVAVVGGATRARRAPFALGAGLLMLLVFVLSIALYDVKLHKMMRSAMFTVPFGAVAVAAALRIETVADALRRGASRTRWTACIATLILAGAGIVASHEVARLGAVAMTRFDSLGDGFTARLEILHDESEVLLAGIEAAPYVLEHYPVVWSLPPTTERTLVEMMERLPVGTILTGAPLSETLLERHSWTLVHSQGHTAGPIYFYKSESAAQALKKALGRGRGRTPENESGTGDR
jgi:hypothetical protein